ncbi:ABC transporter substrate-binding protein [Vogesella sp. LIG4]|uniref:substrate-binding periplasmic protein n=1 Tax=Vogesella sp. LIG4 TaxID=1192162 RepID=UPI00082000DD|nr:transporter substrate-binding domain-containing protein [Vogesella sp. LIG4]SCK11483.1 ABC-type amino acid transport substrate-binding protein [Vogesella sp. LIG4]
MVNQLLRLCLLLTGLTSLAASAFAAPLPLVVALGEHKPPYILQDKHAGIEYELVTTALRNAGYEPQVVFMPNQRAQQALTEGRVDAAISRNGPFVSVPYIAYHNMALTLCERRLRLGSINDLTRYRVAAFHNAQRFLGPEYAAMTRDSHDYTEVSPQPILGNLLYTGRSDVVISDLFVFLGLTPQLSLPAGAIRPVCSHALFPPTLYSLSFRSPEAWQRFNQAIRQLARSGFYAKLARSYQLQDKQGHALFSPDTVVRTPPGGQRWVAPISASQPR